MAGADGIQNHELETLEVPDNLHKRGSKFVKWPKSDGDDTIVATPVTLRIDPKGYIIHWQEPNKDAETLEISSIRDTRIGKYAKIPKDPQIREVAGNTSIPLESKCLTIVYGVRFHDPQFLNFIAVEENPSDIVKLWADFLLELAYHPLTWHISVERSIEKMHTKLIYETNQFGKIPVKKCIKMLGGNQTRAGNALHSVGLMARKNKDETIEPSEFPLIAFKKVLQLICQRPELDKVFTHLGGKMYLSLEQTKRFINTTQRDPRLNEILHPFLTDDQVRTLIAKYEPNVMLANRAQLSLEGLDAYLQSDENLPVTSVRYGLYQDMTQPLAHYFINSSHNTYLTGNQYRSRSTAEMYRQCLLSGCRCVELDCWDSGGQDEPNITHGFTLCSQVAVKDVIEAIDESAFKTSQYPVILSFENHVDSPANQAKMAQYCRDIFGDKLLIDPLDEFPLEPGTPLPSPKELMGKIIVKNKKQKPRQNTVKNSPSEEKSRYLYKRASVPSDNGTLSPSGSGSSSPQMSPQFFSSGKSSQSTSYSGSKSAAMGRKQSAPTIVGSPNLSEGSLKSDVTINGSVATRNGSVGVNGTPKTRKGKGKLRTTHSFEDDPIPEFAPLDLSNPSSATLPRSMGAPQPRKASAPTPTTDMSMFGKDEGYSSPAKTTKPPLKKQESTRGEMIKKQESDDIPEEPEDEENENEEQQNDENGENESEATEGEQGEKAAEEDDDDDEDEDEGQLMKDEFDENMKESGTATKESRAYEAMSSLVNYIQPVRFKSFEHSEKKKRSYEISSLTENAALRLITYSPIEIVNYNKRQLSRIYPKGARVDSSNYNPQLFWNAGCQLVALNFQTLGPNMQLNLGLFEFNKNCGYLLKPEHMRRKDRQFDPFTHGTLDGVVAGSLSIRVISGQFLATSKVSSYVEVDLLGLVADTIKKRYKTSTIQSNGTNPHYNSETFLFKKVVLPALATIRFGVMDTNGNCLGQRFFPVDGLRPGYRYVTLRNEGNQPLTMPSIFVYIEVKDYIPEELEKFAAFLANPIEHLKKKEKEEKEIQDRRKALHRLLDEDEKKEIPSLANEDTTEKPPVILQGPVPEEDPMKPKDQTRIIVMPEENEPQAPAATKAKTLERPGRLSLEQQLTPFQPATLEAIKETKDFTDLVAKMNKKITEYLKKQRDEYDTVFATYFEKPRRTSFNFFSKGRDKLKKINLPFDLNMTLPPEAKKEHMLLLIRKHLEDEKKTRQDMNDTFMKEFEDVVKKEQDCELKRLEKLAEKEKADVHARRKSEKEERLQKIPKDTTKEQLTLKKKEIVERHIQETVQELRMLSTLQEKRVDNVKKEQGEILMMLSDEERSRVDDIAERYNKQFSEVEKIFDIRQADYYQKRGHGPSINSVTYSSDTNDGDYVTKL